MWISEPLFKHPALKNAAATSLLCALTEDLQPWRKIKKIPLTQCWLINILLLHRFLTYCHACCTDGDTANDVRIAKTDNQLGFVWARNGWSLLK